MSEIETDVNLRVSALSKEFITEGDPNDSGRANGFIDRFMRGRAIVQANERYGPLA